MPEEPFKYRNPDGSLNLDAALGEHYVRHYTTMLKTSPKEFAVLQLAAGVETPAPPGEDWYAWREPSPWGMVDGLALEFRGTGPDACSPSVVLVLLPEIIWDVCGYYRRLGFHWTEFRQATARDIREHYLTVDPGTQNSDAFYAATQLLDPDIRKAYDRQPLGGLFLGDRDVRLMLEREAAFEASRRNAEAIEAGLSPEEETTWKEDVLREWGFEPGTSADEAKARLREQYEAQPGEDGGSALGASLSRWGSRWSYWVLADPYGASVAAWGPHENVLEAWQALLCAVLSAHGITEQFAVGLWPGPGPKVWRDSNESCIFFVGKDEQPTHQMANEAVAGYFAQSPQPKRITAHAKLERR